MTGLSWRSAPCGPVRARLGALSQRVPEGGLACCRKAPAAVRPRLRRAGAEAGTGADSGVPPPYTTLSFPVYSLATNGVVNEDGSEGRATLNIITYASPISISPRRFVIGLYKGTQTWRNMVVHREGVLQILSNNHAPLLQLLGKTSAADVDKLAAIESQGFELRTAFGVSTLADAAGIMKLKAASDLIPCGDHDVMLFDVVDWETGDAEQLAQSLDTAFLRAEGYL